MTVVDLTMPMDERTPVFPGDPPFATADVGTLAVEGWRTRQLSFGSHFGTHCEAPAHMIDHGETLDDFPIDRFIGHAVIFDVRGQAKISNPSLDGLRLGDMAFFCTGQTDRAHEESFFKAHPVLTLGLAERLVAAGATVVGIDSFTVDDAPFAVHKFLLSHGILIVENLVNLGSLSGKRFHCTVLPLKLGRADGAPCRVVAEC